MLNTRIQALKPSATLAVKAAAARLRAEGREIIDLSAGEPDIDTPAHITAAAAEALEQGKTKYTDVGGIPELREAIAAKLRSDNGIDCDASRVIVTNGGKQALYEIFDVLLEEGDEVVIPAPYWVSYPEMVSLCRGRPVIVPCTAQNRYKMTPEALSRALTPKTKIVIVNSPSNPTGSGYSAEEFRALGAVLENAPRVLVVSDEVYEKVVFAGFRFSSFAAAVPAFRDRTITVNAFSKSYSMTGWRVGYATGPKEVIAAMAKHQSQATSNISTAGQYGALAAIRGPQDFLEFMVRNFERRTDMAMRIIAETPGSGLHVPVRPDGAFYLFVRIDELVERGLCAGSKEFSAFLMEQSGVAVVPGVEFGDDRAFRISTALSDDTVRDGVTKIVASASSLMSGVAREKIRA